MLWTLLSTSTKTELVRESLHIFVSTKIISFLITSSSITCTLSSKRESTLKVSCNLTFLTSLSILTSGLVNILMMRHIWDHTMAQFLICRLPTLKSSMKKASKMLSVTLMILINNPQQLIQVEFLKFNILLTCFQAMVNMSILICIMARNTKVWMGLSHWWKSLLPLKSTISLTQMPCRTTLNSNGIESEEAIMHLDLLCTLPISFTWSIMSMMFTFKLLSKKHWMQIWVPRILNL